MHTHETIKTLLEKNDKAVVRGLFVAQTNHFALGDAKFGESLLNYYTQNGTLTKYQIVAARKLLVRNYLPLLTRTANAAQQVDDFHNEDNARNNEDALAEMRAEMDAETAAERYYERQAEMAYYDQGYHLID